LATFRSRLPSKEQAVLLFAACVFPVYSWAILRYFRMVPSWDNYLGLWDIVSILAYLFVFALVESLFVFSILALLRVLLPTPIVTQRFVSKASAFILVNALWAVVFDYLALSQTILLWNAPRYVLCALLYLASVGVSWILVHRLVPFAGRIEAFVDRLTVLLYIYIPLSVLSLVVVTVRSVL